MTTTTTTTKFRSPGSFVHDLDNKQMLMIMQACSIQFERPHTHFLPERKQKFLSHVEKVAGHIIAQALTRDDLLQIKTKLTLLRRYIPKGDLPTHRKVLEKAFVEHIQSETLGHTLTELGDRFVNDLIGILEVQEDVDAIMGDGRPQTHNERAASLKTVMAKFALFSILCNAELDRLQDIYYEVFHYSPAAYGPCRNKKVFAAGLCAQDGHHLSEMKKQQQKKRKRSPPPPILTDENESSDDEEEEDSPGAENKKAKVVVEE
jgi:hypothetical protein